MQQQLGFDDAHTVAAGDANNDLLMLQQVGQRGWGPSELVWTELHVCLLRVRSTQQGRQLVQVAALPTVRLGSSSVLLCSQPG